MRKIDFLNVRQAVNRETGEAVTVDDETFNPAWHRELHEAAGPPAKGAREVKRAVRDEDDGA